MRSLKLIGKANQAHQDYIAYRKHFTKLERKSRGYVKGNWRLARLRIKMSLSIRRIEFAEAFKRRLVERIARRWTASATPRTASRGSSRSSASGSVRLTLAAPVVAFLRASS